VCRLLLFWTTPYLIGGALLPTATPPAQPDNTPKKTSTFFTLTDEMSKEKQQATVDASGSLSFSHTLTPIRQAVRGSTPTGSIEIGTPPVAVAMIFDTGSDKLVAKTWDTVKRELQMVDGGIDNEVVPTHKIYNHNSSSTYTAEFINRDGMRRPKRSQITYGSGFAITEDGDDTVTIGTRTLRHFPVSEIMADSLTILHSSDGTAGVLGLQHMKNRSLGESIFTRLRAANMMSAFGYCRSPNNSGTFIWGDKATDGNAMEVVGQIHWAVKLGNFSTQSAGQKVGSNLAKRQDSAGFIADSVRDKSAGDAAGASTYKWVSDSNHLELQSKLGDTTSTNLVSDEPICPNNECVAIIDTGSNIVAGPSLRIASLKRKLRMNADCSNLHTLPSIAFQLGGFPISIPGSALAMKVKLPALVPLNKSHSFIQQRASLNLSSSSTWESVVERIPEAYRLDFREVWHSSPLDRLRLLLHGGTFCVPALVGLDKTTTKGPLWVVGTPLFEKYYTRWAWPPTASSPKIYLEDLSKATSCQQGSPTDKGATTILNEEASVRGQNLMRTEQHSYSHSAVAATVQPMQLQIAQIKYPHWAKSLSDV